MSFVHTTVLLEETVNRVFTTSKGIYVDCTLGGGGHSRLLLQKMGSEGILACFDQDEKAINYARELFGEDKRVSLFKTNFFNLESILKENGLYPVDGIVFDLGVSSPQLDEAERGFSYMHDAPLDMRMDRSSELTAKEIVNHWSEERLGEVIRAYGEERWSSRIAKFICQYRLKEEIVTTEQLVDIIKAAIPAGARREGPHPAKRTFQALRIAVNRELEILEDALQQALRCLKPGGRLAVITFHSLEDRVVKDMIRSWSGKCTCPPGFPICNCGAVAMIKNLTTKPVQPSQAEIEVNPRSRSAKLRVVEKLQV